MKAIINGRLVFPDRICDGVILIEGDRIIASGSAAVPEGAEIIDAKGLYVGPGLIDQHVHGYKQCGECIDVENNTRGTALAHLKHGTTGFTPSAGYSLTREQFLSVIDQCNEAIAAGDTNIVGIHFEGPFTNPLQGACSKAAWAYSDEACDELFRRAGKNVLHCTYAPEMPYGEKMEQVLRRHGVKADIGHTVSDPENIYRAVRNGATIVTHLFDAMGNYKGCNEDVFDMTGDPQECVSDIVLSIPDLYYELICDSRCIHVAAVSIRMTLRCAGEDHVICISDCTGKEGQLIPGDYAPEDPRSATDLNFNPQGELAGSLLTCSMSVANFKRVTGCDIRVAFKCGSTNSARALGIDGLHGTIEPGKFANIIFVDEDFHVKKVIFKGQELKEVR